MKKVRIFIWLFLTLFFINNVNVNAWYGEYDSYTDVGTGKVVVAKDGYTTKSKLSSSVCDTKNNCVILCQYNAIVIGSAIGGIKTVYDATKRANEVDDGVSALVKAYIVGFYDTNNTSGTEFKWGVYWDSPYNGGAGIKKNTGYYSSKKIGAANDVFTKSSKVYISEDGKKDLVNNYNCPDYIYFDGGNWDSVCFDTKKSYCKKKGESPNSAISIEYENPIRKDLKDVKDLQTVYLEKYNNIIAELKENSETTGIPEACRYAEYSEAIPGEGTGEIKSNTIEGMHTILKEKYNSIKTKYTTIPPMANDLDSAIIELDKKYNEAADLCKEINNKNLNQESAEKLNGSYDEISDEYSEYYGMFDDLIFVELPGIQYGKVTCATIFKDANNNYNTTHQLLSTTLRFMQYIGVTLALVLSIIDFIKVVPTQDKDAIKKASSKAVTRLVIAIIIFFVPIILDFILGLVGFNDPTCGLL